MAQQRLQGLYQKLKGQQNAYHLKHAASDDAEDVIHSINGGQYVNAAYQGVAPQRPAAEHLRTADLSQIYSHARVGSAGRRNSGGTHSQQGVRGGTQSQEIRGGVQSSRKSIIHMISGCL